jgi:hypothetical protein
MMDSSRSTLHHRKNDRLSGRKRGPCASAGGRSENSAGIQDCCTRQVAWMSQRVSCFSTATAEVGKWAGEAWGTGGCGRVVTCQSSTQRVPLWPQVCQLRCSAGTGGERTACSGCAGALCLVLHSSQSRGETVRELSAVPFVEATWEDPT